MAMRPKEKGNELNLKRVFPLFLWCECKKCGNEFRREPMWRWVRLLPMQEFDYDYACLSCARTEEQAMKLANVPVFREKPPGAE